MKDYDLKDNESLEPFFDFIEKNIKKINQTQKKQYFDFYKLLKINNLNVNLISRKEKNIIERHFINSVTMATVRPFSSDKNVVDIGSGGGFPAIILKILYPDTFFLLIDSVKKKTVFLKKAISELELKKIDVIAERAEKVLNNNPQFSHYFDYVTARAVAPMDKLVKYSLPLLKPDGEMIFLKGKNYGKELNAVKNFKKEIINILQLPNQDENQNGVIVILKKHLHP